MNIFEVKEYQWDKYMKRVMGNINLEEIKIQQNSNIELIFSNTLSEKNKHKIDIKNVLKVNIDNDGFMNGGFPHFILDIYTRDLSSQEVESGLLYYRYGFPFKAQKKLIESSEYKFISIIGSEIMINVLCKEFIITKKSE